MSRQINLYFQMTKEDSPTDIELRAPYFLFGTQQTSMDFWSLPVWHGIGVTQLAELGHSDPVYFVDWPMIDELALEIRCFEDNFSKIDFHPNVKSEFLAHLVYCHSLLVSTAPKHSIPGFTIG